MPVPDVHTRLLHPLNATGIPYMVTGGLAAIIYGESRLTNDVDIVLQLEVDAAARLIAAFPAPAYYTPPIEYVILRKLEYYRLGSSDRHLTDVAAMRRISGEMIDQPALAVWIARLGLEVEWRLAARATF